LIARPLRLLITADAVGGVWQYATDLARGLERHGIEPIIALLGPALDPAQRALARDIRLIETELPLDWLCDGPEPVLAAGEAIAAIARTEGVDCVQLNMPTLAADASFDMPVLAMTHGCVATWWSAAKTEPLIADFRWHEELTGRGLRAVDRVVAPSGAYGAVVQHHYGLDRVPQTVHNGRRPLPMTGAAATNEVIAVGRLWDSVKNGALLDRVAARLPVPFHAAGAVCGPHGETITLRHLKPLGVVDEAALGEALSRRPIFVSAATFEPFGLSVLEAAQAGCPLILSDIPTFRELWGNAAQFVSSDDEDGFVDAIQGVLADEGRRRALGHAARQRAQRYTPAAMVATMARLYHELAPAADGRVAA
jgi:glycosyltransferase involved in cell wall biosynthesis